MAARMAATGNVTTHDASIFSMERKCPCLVVAPIPKSAPQVTVSVDAKRIPPEALFFNLSWTYNPPQKWLRHASNKKKGK